MTDLKDIKTNFKDKSLFDLALTHRSWLNENNRQGESNERLEFLGDAVLELAVSVKIYKELPKKEEGFLTAIRANLVNTKNLAEVATALNLGSSLKLSKGEEQGGGRENPSLLADTTEALIGAIFLDQGYSAAEEFIQKNLLKDLAKKLEEPLKDPKSRLQELVQAKGYLAPKYKVVKESGPDHAKIFEVAVEVDGKKVGTGKGNSKGIAQQEAAAVALEHFL